MDEETYNIVSSFKKIAKHYLKKSFMFDFIAWFPLSLFMDSTKPLYARDRRLFRLLRLLRLPRLAQLLDVEKCKSILNEYYGKKLENSVIKNDNEFSFPIMRVIIIVHTYNLFSIIVVIFTVSYFLGILWLIIIRDYQNWQNMEMYDVHQRYKTFYTQPGYGFIADQETEYHEITTLIKVWYFAITTLSTIGFGDFSPKSVMEKLLGSFILLFGVVVFSIIMSKLIDILVSFKSIDQQGAHKDLSKWIAMLSKYNGGHPINKNIITEIEDFFDFYWKSNKMKAFQSTVDKRFMDELPESVVQQIYIDFVF